MSIGKLYNSHDEQFLTEVNYNLLDGSDTGWWGELTLVDYMRLEDGNTFMIEMEDGRKGRCSLKKRVTMTPRFLTLEVPFIVFPI